MQFFSSMCCESDMTSKATRIKSLEAKKSRLEDFIRHIDEKIADLQKEGEEV